jgi:RimJ/RimL family protein N-acetyltransferase
MNHDLTVEAHGLRLRPVRISDAGFIVLLRNSPHALGNVGDSAAEIAAQEKWLLDYFSRPNDYYFIIESRSGGRPVGTVGIYDVTNTTGEWGRWIVTRGVFAGPGSAWLAFHVCFDLLHLQTVLGHVVETNRAVLSFHQKIGFPIIGLATEPRTIGGSAIRMVALRASTQDWPTISSKLQVYARAAERFL